ncbi:FUSC family protein [Microbacterium sp. CJ88]|uniref:FUSC family protein n=1 Tax=Microbacterium sp. CJ88 TaxID=3445672 RepID=UPI003F65A523
MRLPVALRSPRRGPFLQVAKSGIATIAAWLVAGWVIDGPPPVFAAIAALLVVQPSLNQSLGKAVERSVGVIVGVVIASLLGLVFGRATWVVLVAIGAALVVAWMLRMTPGTANQVAISAMLVLALAAATPNYALDRVLETIIGAIIGILVNVAVVPPVSVAPARSAVDGLVTETAASLDRLAAALEQPRSAAQLQELLLEARLLRPMRDAADASIAAAQESLTLNPRGRRYRDELAALSARLDRFGPIVTQLIGMTRAVVDRYDDGLGDEPTVRAIAEQLRRAAHDARLATLSTDAAASVDSALEPPALTTPLTVTAPSRLHWVLVGSLLEDLRRIHEALSDGADRA